jgi:inner membrane protein YidH
MSLDNEPAAVDLERLQEEAHDASRRTRLANERTYLAWWRTGLASLAVGLGTGKLLPAVASGTQWPYTVVGIGFTAIGVFFIAYAFERHKRVEAAVLRGEFAPPQERVIAGLAIVGVVLGLLVIVLILTSSR